MMETLAVIVFCAGIFTFLYVSVLPLIGTYNDLIIRESNIDIVYKLYNIRLAIQKDNKLKNDLSSDNFTQISCSGEENDNIKKFKDENYCNNLMTQMELTNYNLFYTDSIKNNIESFSSYTEVYKYLDKYKEEDNPALVLIDNKEHTIAHLNYYEINPSVSMGELILKKVPKTGTCSNIIYEEDGIKYFSGTNDCVNFNYVWYSGKLWRITAIYPDGSMKMITEDVLTSIYWGSTVEYDGSWVYQWLNEDFYDTLVNPTDIIIANSIWNYSTDGNDTPVKPETIATQKTKEAPIGLLNAYEYYNSSRKISSSIGYLNIGYTWWLLTPSSTSRVRRVINAGSMYSSSLSGDAFGIRPSIVIKSGLEFTGSGTKSNPYKIVGDKETPANGTLISSRSSGEYVKFDNDIYRIVSIDETNGTTKLTRVDYLRDNGTVVTKNFASSAYFGKSTNTGEDTYWDYYLNNTWYNNITTNYKNMLVDGTYYLGLYAGSGKHYKITTCKDIASTLDSITTKNCTKYTSSDSNKTFTGKVGLPRVGEMFSVQLGSGYSSSTNMWTITPYSTSRVRYVDDYGNLFNDSPSSSAYGVRPSINLKSGIKITGGIGYVGGDTNSPFEISN